MNSIRIMIVHKNKALRHRLADYLTVAGMITVNDALSLRKLQEKAHQCKPHIILLDIQHAGDEFPVFLKNLKQTLPQVKLVFIGPEPQAYYARHSATMGADLYLSEGQHPNEWLRRLRAIAPQKGKPVATTHCGSYPIRRGLVSHQTSREEEI